MRILEFALNGNGIWPDVRTSDLSHSLTAFLGPSASGKSTIAGLLAHVLYGKIPNPGIATPDRYSAQPDGELLIEDQGDRYRLRRYNDIAPPGRLTVSSPDGAQLNAKTVQNLLSGISSVVLSKIYAVDVASERGLQQLLSEQFAEHFLASAPAIHEPAGDDRPSVCPPDHAELLNRRDELASELQVRVTEERHRSHELDKQLQELDSLQEKQVAEAAELNRQLQAVDVSLADVEARLRYDRLETSIRQQQSDAVPVDLDLKLEELDAQIQLWRSTLAHLGQQESSIRDRLAQTHPDDTAARFPLADQRTHLAVLQRLATDLNAELAQLARSTDSEICVCREAQPRLRPLAEALGKHLAHLDQSICDQEQVLTHQELSGEAQQLARSRVQIREQLQILLDRRQSLIRPTHRHLSRKLTQSTAGSLDNPEHVSPDQLELTRRQLEQERAELRQQLAQQQEIHESTERQRIQTAKDHVALLSGVSLEQVCSELAAIQLKLHRQLAQADESPAQQTSPKQPKASDYLAQLSSGQFLQLEIDPQTRQLTVFSRENRRHSIESLKPAEQDLVYLSLILSLVTAQRNQGTQLPLVLDEPFARMNEHQAVTTASVLENFARAGNQVLVFTNRTDAANRFRSGSQTVIEMRQLYCASDTDVELLPNENPREKPVSPKVDDRFEDEPGFLLGIDHPIARFPALGRKTDSAFTAIDIHTVGDLIGADPAKVADKLAIDGITTEIVRLWQTHQVFMCFIPNVTLYDAQLMTGIGANTPDYFINLKADLLLERIESFLNSKRGKRLAARGLDFHPELAHQWIQGVRKYRSRWQHSVAGQHWRDRCKSYASPQKAHLLPRTNREAPVSPKAHHSQSGNSLQAASPRETGSLKSADFHLEMTSNIKQAPSISRKTAARFESIGIAQVVDFLNADPIEIARQLNVRHLKANKLASWQHQARLMCQVSGLQDFSVQILVGCNLTDPSQIAQMKPKDLLDWITPFCDTKEGEQILRGRSRPDLGEVTRWIDWAAESRIQEAA
ncbi:MAG: hypothetical protein MK161_13965 [Pirellulales bacterium]|nr:hypothetical protein [Pirellulales bacterium]